MWPIWPCSNNPTGNHNHRTWHLKVQVDWYELIGKTVVFHICTTLLHFPRMWFLLLDLNLKKKKWNETNRNGKVSRYYAAIIFILATEPKGDEGSLDAFGMPGFSPSPTIHPSFSSASLTASDEVDKGMANSPALTRRSILPTSLGARDGFIKLHMAAREDEYTHVKTLK